jgi:arginyl-tRNA--protein-N-Asp/Glu arginylyltransferase
MEYLHWDEKTINDFSEKAVADMYNHGYVFTRIGKGVMHQTRSVRIDLSKFELSSENRRVLKKVSDVVLVMKNLPLTDYNYKLGMDAKYFYDTKFKPGIMSAQKVKEMLTDPVKSNFNQLLTYSSSQELGYCITHTNSSLIHYSYPFYHIDMAPKDMGLGMMIMAIEWANAQGLKYVYLGSLQRPTDTYKLQFAGLEWFDGGKDGSQTWSNDLEKVKKILAEK